ncbi:MAG: thioredoxin domain-containing protein [Microgenomates group bacterium]
MKEAITQYIVVVALVVGSYFLGVYKTKTEFLEKGVGTTTTTTTATPNTPAQQPQNPATVDLKKIQEKFDGKHITFGKANAKIIITEISDPSCPFCHIAGGLHPELNNQSEQFKMVADGGTYQAPVPEIKKLIDSGKASFIFLYAPGHGSGEVGTQAMYCAYEQGKFWEAHDKLMTKAGYDLLNNEVKNDLAQSSKVVALIGNSLDSGKLQSCLDSKKYVGQTSEDTNFVQALGFGATPTFFVNSTIVEGAQSWTAFKPTVDSLL